MIEHVVREMEGRPEIEKELAEEVHFFVTAGSDTTSNLMTAVVFFLFEHPPILEKVKQEIKEVGLDDGTEITPQALKELKYLDLVLKEAGRLAAPAPFYFFRKAERDMHIGDIPIKKGVLLNNFWVVNFFDSADFDKPFEFVP